MEVWILVNNRAGRQHARENGEQVRRVFALGGARARVAYTDLSLIHISEPTRRS